MKRIPTKQILWVQVFAALFAAVIALVCFFTPLTSLKASGNVGGLFDDYLTYAYTKKLADGESASDLDKEFESYNEFLETANEVDEEGNLKGAEVNISMAGFLFNTVNMVKMFVHVSQIENLKTAEGETAINLMESLSKADFGELNETSLGLTYYFSSYIFNEALDTVGDVAGSESVSGGFATILGFIINLILMFVVVVMYAIAAVKAVLLLVGMINHISAPEGYFEASSKKVANLLSTLLFATLLGSVTSNGGGLAAGGVIVVVCSIVVLCVNVAAAYLKKNTPAQLKYLITTHALGLISILGIALALIGTTSAGLGDWVLTRNADQAMRDLASKAEKYTETYSSYIMIASIVNIFGKFVGIILISYLINVLINTTMLTENKQTSFKKSPVYQAIMTLVATLISFVLIKFAIGIEEIPNMGMLVLSWIGAIIFIAVQFMRNWAYAKFTDISVSEKALLLAGCPDGENAPAPAAEAAPAPVAEEVAPTEEN